MTALTDLHNKWLEEPAYRQAFKALEEEFTLAAAIAEAAHERPKISSDPLR